MAADWSIQSAPPSGPAASAAWRALPVAAAEVECPFRERLGVTSVGARFLVDFYDLVDRWAAWATEVVEARPEDPAEAEPSLEVDEYILRLAAARAQRASPSAG